MTKVSFIPALLASQMQAKGKLLLGVREEN
jgi:hypothetical protein